MSPEPQLVEVDDQGRIAFPEGWVTSGTYRVVRFDSGVLLVEPAHLVTEAELAYRVDPALTERVDRSVDQPETRVQRGRLPRAVSPVG